LTPDTTDTAESVALQTREWLQRLVIGLNLCPFAQKPLAAGLVAIVVSDAATEEALLRDLDTQLNRLDTTPASELETTLLVAPAMLDNFLDYNDFIGRAEDHLSDTDFAGHYQIASFHPHYQFAGTRPDDAENHTNRAPYPTLHLLREASLEQALATFPHPEQIPERNIATMNRLGSEALLALQASVRQYHKGC
jgi:uncharacterized protein